MENTASGSSELSTGSTGAAPSSVRGNHRQRQPTERAEGFQDAPHLTLHDSMIMSVGPKKTNNKTSKIASGKIMLSFLIGVLIR